MKKYLLLILLFFLPIFEIRLISTLGIVYFVFRKKRTFKKKQIFFSLFLLYSFSFLLTPYWHVFQTISLLKYIFLVVLTILGMTWAWKSSQTLVLPQVFEKLWAYAITPLFIYLILFREIASPIAWRGDEDAHVSLILHLQSYVSYWWQNFPTSISSQLLFLISCILIISIFGLIIYLRHNKKRFQNVSLIALPIFILIGSIIFYPSKIFKNSANPILLSEILRYPFLQRWIHLFFIIFDTSDVRMYRFVPFISLVLLSWLLIMAYYRRTKDQFMALVVSCSFVTIPLLMFYGAILYLEMPVVLLFFIIVTQINSLVTLDSKSLFKVPAWYCLLVAGFLKESAFIIFISIILLRVIYQLQYNFFRKNLIDVLFVEFRTGALMSFPVVLYLLFRYVFSRFHPYIFVLQNSFNYSYYYQTFSQLFVQGGVTVIIGVFGLLALYFHRDKKYFWYIFILIFGEIAFYISTVFLDFTYSGNGIVYAGYSRWLLYLVPPLFVVAMYQLSKITKFMQLILIAGIICSNLMLFPFASDATRKPNWGVQSNVDLAEYTYPYDQAVKRLAELHSQSVLQAGLYSPYYGIYFYFKKYNYQPEFTYYLFDNNRFDINIEKEKFAIFFADLPRILKIRNIQPRAIIYHSVNNLNLDPYLKYSNNYILTNKFSNAFHSLYIFVAKADQLK